MVSGDELIVDARHSLIYISFGRRHLELKEQPGRHQGRRALLRTAALLCPARDRVWIALCRSDVSGTVER